MRSPQGPPKMSYRTNPATPSFPRTACHNAAAIQDVLPLLRTRLRSLRRRHCHNFYYCEDDNDTDYDDTITITNSTTITTTTTTTTTRAQGHTGSKAQRQLRVPISSYEVVPCHCPEQSSLSMSATPKSLTENGRRGDFLSVITEISRLSTMTTCNITKCQRPDITPPR